MASCLDLLQDADDGFTLRDGHPGPELAALLDLIFVGFYRLICLSLRVEIGPAPDTEFMPPKVYFPLGHVVLLNLPFRWFHSLNCSNLLHYTLRPAPRQLPNNRSEERRVGKESRS